MTGMLQSKEGITERIGGCNGGGITINTAYICFLLHNSNGCPMAKGWKEGEHPGPSTQSLTAPSLIFICMRMDEWQNLAGIHARHFRWMSATFYGGER